MHLPTLSPGIKRLAQGMLALLVSVVSIILALRKVSWPEVGNSLVKASPALVGLALLSVAINTAAKVIRWQVLLNPARQRISAWHLAVSLLAGQALNTIYPARLGDISRILTVSRLGPDWVYVLGSLVLEKLADSLCYAILFFAMILLLPLPGWVNDSILAVIGLSLVLLALAFVIAFRRRWVLLTLERITRSIKWLPSSMREQIIFRLHSAMDSLEVLKRWPDLIKLALWSALIWGTAAWTNSLALQALHLHIPWTAAVLILVILQAGISLPAIPGKVGIFEVTCMLALAVFGIQGSIALSYGILLHVIVLVPSTLVGLACVAYLGLPREHQISQDSFNLPREG